MTYCSFCGARNPNVPIATLKNGETFNFDARMTTTDVLQLMWVYCEDKSAAYIPKETVTCTSEDRVVAGFHRPVFVDRLCDNRVDCREAEDELGGLGQCIPVQPPTANGCCSLLIVRGVECAYVSQINGHDAYQCADDDDHVIYYHNNQRWLSALSGFPTGGGYSFNLYEITDNACPPIGLWSSGGQFTPQYVFCKADGVDQEDGCDPNPCGPNANCVDLFDGYRCECPEGPGSAVFHFFTIQIFLLIMKKHQKSISLFKKMEYFSTLLVDDLSPCSHKPEYYLA